MHRLLKTQEVDINRIFETHASGLKGVEENLRSLFRTNVMLINTIGEHLVASGGKRIRPLFTLASAALAGYSGSDHIRLAAIVESIHTASLLHDDVVDGADLRRGRPTAHSLWGNSTVILVGDYLYSNALKQAVMFRNQDIMDALSTATTGMTRGELMQLQYSSDVEITEETYMEIISAKTGGLISAACRIGGIVAGISRDKEDALAAYGMKVGTAFQMADDILDYMADQDNLGKGLGRDLDEGKVTLPMIYLFREASDAEREELASILEQDLSEKGLNRILALFEHYSVLQESVSRAKGLVEEAKRELSVFSTSSERQDMYDLADYALGRVK